MIVAAVITSIAAVIAAMITTCGSSDGDKHIQTANNSPGAVLQNLENSPGSIQAAGSVLIHPQEVPEAELRSQIRQLLHDINPLILKRIDAGEPSVSVMINVSKLQQLFYLSSHPVFAKYLGLQSTGNQMRGVFNGNAQIGDNINDVNPNGALDGYILIIGDPLREKSVEHAPPGGRGEAPRP